VRLVHHSIGGLAGLRQHVVPAPLRVAGQVPAVLLGLGHVVVGGLLGPVQDADRLEMRVPAGAEAVVGVAEYVPPEPAHLLLEGGALAQQPPELVLDLVTERPHLLFVEPAAAQVRAPETDRLDAVRRQPLLSSRHDAHGMLPPKSPSPPSGAR